MPLISSAPVRTFILTDKTWHRGNSAGSYVNAGVTTEGRERPRCCLGNACAQLGIRVPVFQPGLAQEVIEAYDGFAQLAYMGDALNQVYWENDQRDEWVSDTERVARINAYTRPCGFEFVYIPDGESQS